MSKKKESKEVVVTSGSMLPVSYANIVIDNKTLTPVASFNYPGEKIAYNDVNLLPKCNFFINGPISFSKGELQLDLFIYQDERIPCSLYILADESSSLTMGFPYHLKYCLKEYSHHSLVMVNSSSSSDCFTGNNVLSNVNSSLSDFVDSQINGIGYSNRVSVYEVTADNFKFNGGCLRSGEYSESKMEYVTFGSSRDYEPGSIFKRDRVNKSNITYVSFEGKSIDINDSQITQCGFEGIGDVTLHNQTFEYRYFNDQIESVKLLSRFDYTAIDILSHTKAVMARVDDDNVVILLPPGRDGVIKGDGPVKLLKMSFKNPNSRRNLVSRTINVFFGDVPPSDPEESVIEYMVDTILSRCKMMNLLDTSRRLVVNDLLKVKNPTPRFKDVGPWSLNKLEDNTPDTGNTIYISQESFDRG